MSMERFRRGLKAGCVLATLLLTTKGHAVEPARAIVNAIDPKSMNELLDVSRSQRDAALTNVIPTSGNRFRFLFVWPASNPVMTYERIGRSFAERFLQFAQSQVLLADGYCLLTKNMSFGTAPYASEMVNVAYRDIEVRYNVGPRTPCPGKYIAATDIDENRQPADASTPSFRATPPTLPLDQPKTPLEGLKPFLAPPPPSQ